MILLHLHQDLLLFHFQLELYFLPSNLNLYSNDKNFMNIFDWLIPAIIMKICIFKSSALFGTHTLLNKPLIVFQLPAHLSNLTANG